MPVHNTVVAIDMPPHFYAALWMFFSNLTILFNKWLIDDAGFPIILTCWHMTFATAATQLLARKTCLLDGRHRIKMVTPLYMKTIVPIGLLYSGSIIFNNLVYLHLSVPFIQMLKATGPVVTLIVGWLWGVEHPTWSKCSHIMLIVGGVTIASAGEIQFSWPGVIFQVTGILFESIRVIMIQSLMSSKGLVMDPLVSLYYYAPVCAITNFAVSLFFEWNSFEWTHVIEVGLGILTLNAIVAFLLNVCMVFLIGKMSALAYVLVSVLKNILLVISAVAIWRTPIASIQLLGYSLALIGLGLYQLKWEGTGDTLRNIVRAITSHSRFRARKPRLLIAALIITALLAVVFIREGRMRRRDPPTTKTIEEVNRLSNRWLTWLNVEDGK
ncbi:TPT-domain-containing protein [Annulohypoxylon bovei var. microspora]|nr:TPT-domain-containing protein [Annulohypoxylon bovei var. microspora]